jgi:hypothetical protein
MKISKRLLSIAATAALFLMASSSTWAQSSEPAEQTPPPPPPHRGGAMFERMGPGFEGMGFVGFEAGLDGKTVTGAPFTASFSTQTTETLTDGNKIQRSSTGTFARDTAGRTRRDMTLPAIGPWAASGTTPPQVSFINDPVAGTRYVLEVNKKTVRQMSAHQGHPKVAPAASGEKSAAFQKQTTTESLGTQTINGIAAQGTRYTRTIPAGEMGNDKPIVIVTERWYSSELQTMVMTKRSDPRTGQTEFQLTNIQRAEPAATLFQVPAGYTVAQGRRGAPAAQPAPEPAPQQ